MSNHQGRTGHDRDRGLLVSLLNLHPVSGIITRIRLSRVEPRGPFADLRPTFLRSISNCRAHSSSSIRGTGVASGQPNA